MSLKDIEERNLITKRMNNAASKERMLRRNIEFQRRRVKVIDKWLLGPGSAIKNNHELSDLYVNMLINKRK